MPTTAPIVTIMPVRNLLIVIFARCVCSLSWKYIEINREVAFSYQIHTCLSPSATELLSFSCGRCCSKLNCNCTCNKQEIEGELQRSLVNMWGVGHPVLSDSILKKKIWMTNTTCREKKAAALACTASLHVHTEAEQTPCTVEHASHEAVSAYKREV